MALMSWVRIDDHMADHPKILVLGELEPFAVTLQLRALCWSSRYSTDGFIAEKVVQALVRGFPAQDWPTVMMDAGLWDKAKGGWRVHDYLTYNPSRAQVLASRESARERMGKLRNGSLNVRTNIPGSSSEVHDSPSPSPTTTAWTREAVHDWVTAYGGKPSYGKLGRQLKPLLETYTWAEIRPAWCRYLAATKGQYASAQRFTETFGDWYKSAKDNYLRPEDLA